MVTPNQQRIYNNYLHALRTCTNQPFRPRKDFSDLQPTTVVGLAKLETFFNKYDHIDQTDYFEAPFKVTPDTKHTHLEYYITPNALSMYVAYMKHLRNVVPDDDIQLARIVSSLKFIGSFIHQNKITLSQYSSFKIGMNYCWYTHFKNHKLNPYILVAFAEIYDKIMQMPEDEKDLFFGDFWKQFGSFQLRLNSSTVAKDLISRGFQAIENTSTSVK